MPGRGWTAKGEATWLAEVESGTPSAAGAPGAMFHCFFIVFHCVLLHFCTHFHCFPLFFIDTGIAIQTGGAQVSFQLKNPDFLLKNPDFLFRNSQFLLKHVDFMI